MAGAHGPSALPVRSVAILLFAALLSCSEPQSNRNNHDPEALITAPVDGATYEAGDVITFSGSATDDEDGTLGTGSLSWWAEFHHDTHTHPFRSVTDGASGQVTIPTSGEVSANVWYRFYLRAVDSDGNVDTTFTEIFPEKATMTFTTVPAGLSITIDGMSHATPYVVEGVVGIEREIGAPDQSNVDSTWAFASWSQGGAQSQTLVTPQSNTTYTATFTGVGPGNAPPTVTLTAPAGGSSSAVNTPVTLTATANDADGTVASVQFRAGNETISTDASSPYSATWTPTVSGAYVLTAIATDNDGSSTTSAPVNVTVTGGGGGDTQPPTAAITGPNDGSLNLTGTPTVAATATDNVGVVAVEFQLDGVSLGEDTSSPYSMVYPQTANYTTGAHLIRVRSRDAAGNLSAWATSRVTFGGSVNQPAGFTRTNWITGLSGSATAMTFAPDGRLFIAQKSGALRIVKNGALLPTAFTTISVDDDGERGLLGVAFDPNYATNRYVYVYYTTPTSPHNRISRFTASTANPDTAVAGSELPLVNLPNLSSATNHNGGAIHFGPDGKLYVAVGDNAQGSNSQSMNTVLGKILRYNAVDGSIPTDNPFYGTASGNNRAIWALGLRNPFTFGFQPGSGRMFINDVGEGSWEEINVGAAGANYGWPGTEGNTTNPAYTSPLFTYGHSANPTLITGFAIVGSAFYNPGTPMFGPEYVGNYFFADYVNHWVYRLDTVNGNGVYAFARLPAEVVDLAVGNDGALYALGYISGNWGVFRFTK